MKRERQIISENRGPGVHASVSGPRPFHGRDALDRQNGGRQACSRLACDCDGVVCAAIERLLMKQAREQSVTPTLPQTAPSRLDARSDPRTRRTITRVLVGLSTKPYRVAGLTDDPEHRGLGRNVYASVQAAYTEAKSILYDAQAGFETLEQRQSDAAAIRRDGSVSTQSRSRLPQIHVPEFSGLREDWESFRDLFLALVHTDETLSNVERLYYLKTLKVEASSAVG
ncbi:hypothetical protein TKK_0013702 [Trichogramma kaykai]